MPFVLFEDGSEGWIEESKAKPTDSKLWNRARSLAHMDKEYTPFTSRLLTRRIYQMLGGAYAPVKQRGKSGKISAKKR